MHGPINMRFRERGFIQETNIFIVSIQLILAHISLNSRKNPVPQTSLHWRKRAYPRC